jgi:hypothetical protein
MHGGAREGNNGRALRAVPGMAAKVGADGFRKASEAASGAAATSGEGCGKGRLGSSRATTRSCSGGLAMIGAGR